MTRPDDDRFGFDLPAGWIVEPDDESGVLISREDGAGLLHLVGFEPPSEVGDPAEELFAFLDEQDLVLDEADVEDVDLADGELAMVEYIAEAEDGEGEDEELTTYWLVAVALMPGALVFANYSCPAGDEDAERDAVLRILRSLRPAVEN